MKRFKINYEITDYYKDNDNYGCSNIYDSTEIVCNSVHEIIIEIKELMDKYTFTTEEEMEEMGYAPECRCINFGFIIEFETVFEFNLATMEEDFPECYI